MPAKTITLPSETRMFPVDTSAVDPTLYPAGTLFLHTDGVMKQSDGSAFQDFSAGGDLDTATADLTYLKITDASSTYLSQANAASTYIAQADGSDFELPYTAQLFQHGKTVALEEIGGPAVAAGLKIIDVTVLLEYGAPLVSTVANTAIRNALRDGDAKNATIEIMNVSGVNQTIACFDSAANLFYLASDMSNPVPDIIIRNGNCLKIRFLDVNKDGSPNLFCTVYPIG